MAKTVCKILGVVFLIVGLSVLSRLPYSAHT